MAMEKTTKLVYFIERLGDRIALKYVSEYYKNKTPNLDLWSYETYAYSSVKGFNIREWVPDLFSRGYVGGQRINQSELGNDNACRMLNVDRLWPKPGNLFVFVPKRIRETGKYPSLEVPARLQKWLDEDFSELVGQDVYDKKRPIICFHCLTDASYSTSRNHVFEEWEKAIEKLSKQDVTIFRIGANNSMKSSVRNDRNVWDFAERNYPPSETMSVISLSDIYVGGDTGMTHAASAFGKKIVGIWGDITHMLRDKSSRNNIQPGDWDSGPYVPEEDRYMLRRTGGEAKISPVFKADQILEGLNHFLEKM